MLTEKNSYRYLIKSISVEPYKLNYKRNPQKQDQSSSQKNRLECLIQQKYNFHSLNKPSNKLQNILLAKNNKFIYQNDSIAKSNILPRFYRQGSNIVLRNVYQNEKQQNQQINIDQNILVTLPLNLNTSKSLNEQLNSTKSNFIEPNFLKNPERDFQKKPEPNFSTNPEPNFSTNNFYKKHLKYANTNILNHRSSIPQIRSNCRKTFNQQSMTSTQSSDKLFIKAAQRKRIISYFIQKGYAKRKQEQINKYRDQIRKNHQETISKKNYKKDFIEKIINKRPESLSNNLASLKHSGMFRNNIQAKIRQKILQKQQNIQPW